MSDNFTRVMVGTAEVDVTPPIGTQLAGYGYERISEGVILPLKARILVMNEGEKRCVLINCDFLAVTVEETNNIRKLIHNLTGIAPERVMICCTHSHTGPEMRGVEDWCVWEPNEEYLDQMNVKVAEAVAVAAQNQTPAIICMGKQHEEGLAFNRRFRMKNAEEQFGPDKMHPTAVDIDENNTDCAGVAGPIDPEFGVVLFKRELTSKPFAMIVNYSLHVDVTSGNKISSDFPGIMAETLKKIYGEELVTLYIQGACGNINHCAYLQNNPYPGTGEWKSEQIGRAFAGKAMNIAEKALPSKTNVIEIATEILDVPRYPKDDIIVRKMLKDISSKKEEELTFFETSFMKLYNSYSDERTDKREIMTLRIGDAVFCSAPGELFVEWGLEIKKWSPFEYTFIAELCNDYVGYIPTFEAFYRGGYEASPIISVKATSALGMMIADANFRNLHKLAEL